MKFNFNKIGEMTEVESRYFRQKHTNLRNSIDKFQFESLSNAFKGQKGLSYELHNESCSITSKIMSKYFF